MFSWVSYISYFLSVFPQTTPFQQERVDLPFTPLNSWFSLFKNLFRSKTAVCQLHFPDVFSSVLCSHGDNPTCDS